MHQRWRGRKKRAMRWNRAPRTSTPISPMGPGGALHRGARLDRPLAARLQRADGKLTDKQPAGSYRCRPPGECLRSPVPAQEPPLCVRGVGPERRGIGAAGSRPSGWRGCSLAVGVERQRVQGRRRNTVAGQVDNGLHLLFHSLNQIPTPTQHALESPQARGKTSPAGPSTGPALPPHVPRQQRDVGLHPSHIVFRPSG
jgi:hypothetical protein